MSAHNPHPGTSSTAHTARSAELTELLDDENTALTLDALAHACHMEPGWVITRLQEGLLQTGIEDADGNPTTWRFTSATVVRARRLAHLEATFDADPQLAALTTDLIEEVARLRQQLRHLEAR